MCQLPQEGDIGAAEIAGVSNQTLLAFRAFAPQPECECVRTEDKMAMVVVNACVATVLVAVALFRRNNATIRRACVVMLLVLQGWISLHHAVAYREVPAPSDADLAVEPRRVWLAGTGAMTCYTLTIYVPTFGICALALAILAMTPLAGRAKRRKTDADKTGRHATSPYSGNRGGSPQE